MALPAFLKSPYIMGSSGVVGIGGISTVALSVGGNGVDYSESIRRNESARSTLVSNLSNAGQLGTKCVQEFFGEENSFSFSIYSSISSGPDISFKAPEKPTVSEPKGNVTGCSYVQFSSKGKEAFIFQTETTVKNDKVGLALFSSGRNVKHSDSSGDHATTGGTKEKLVSKTDNVIMYYLFFLEKEQENWKIKGGYSWADRTFSGGFKDVNLHLKAPSENIDFNGTWTGIDGNGIEYVDKEWEHKMYYGSWSGKKNGSGKEVFEDIELWGVSKGNAEILGRDYSNTFVDKKENKGYEDKWQADHVVHKYEYMASGDDSKINQWHQRQTLTISTLDNWYAPFRGEKGNWVEESTD